MEISSRKACLVGPGRIEIKRLTIAPGPEDILIRVKACGLCNWELNHWKGLLGQPGHQLGHETVGYVEAIGDKVPEGLFKEGDGITSLAGAGFADYVFCDYRRCVKLEENVFLEGALGEPLMCVLTTLRGVAPEVGDIGVVVGCGPMGLWCIQCLAGNFLSALIAVDISPERLKLAREFGATHVVNPREEDAVELIKAVSGGHMADFVIEGTGRPQTLQSCLDYLRVGRGRLALMSSHEEGDAAFDWRPAQVKAVQIVVTHPSFNIHGNDNMRRVGELLNRGVLDSRKLITHRFPLEGIEDAFRALENKPAGYLKGVVVP